MVKASRDEGVMDGRRLKGKHRPLERHFMRTSPSEA